MGSQGFFDFLELHWIFCARWEPDGEAKSTGISLKFEKIRPNIRLGLNFALSFTRVLMSFAGDKPQLNRWSATEGWEADRMRYRASGEASRVDFHHASSHLNQKGPGYYLILLRNEIKHRSLRGKPNLLT